MSVRPGGMRIVVDDLTHPQAHALLHEHALYERNGFARCGPFADYMPNGFSVFMSKAL
ncbi:hypothetical protein [Jeongeupia sp. USM3]|uniref:hypothetical protein n=1 Tax=Jeongeupia sp. USM3 TaxID=1906741 RepID=UPI00196B8F81|nr:hypothetical protein [Jeongeupia sp. USM3]